MSRQDSHLCVAEFAKNSDVTGSSAWSPDPSQRQGIVSQFCSHATHSSKSEFLANSATWDFLYRRRDSAALNRVQSLTVPYSIQSLARSWRLTSAVRKFQTNRRTRKRLSPLVRELPSSHSGINIFHQILSPVVAQLRARLRIVSAALRQLASAFIQHLRATCNDFLQVEELNEFSCPEFPISCIKISKLSADL